MLAFASRPLDLLWSRNVGLSFLELSLILIILTLCPNVFVVITAFFWIQSNFGWLNLFLEFLLGLQKALISLREWFLAKLFGFASILRLMARIITAQLCKFEISEAAWFAFSFSILFDFGTRGKIKMVAIGWFDEPAYGFGFFYFLFFIWEELLIEEVVVVLEVVNLFLLQLFLNALPCISSF